MPTIVAAALYREEQVLLCHRVATRRWYPDVWDFPGGHVESGESRRCALIREVREELSVDVNLHHVAAQPHAEVTIDDVQLSIWRITSWIGEPVNAATNEHDVIGWFNLSDALRLRLAHADYPALLTRLVAATPTA